jgi:hypothetical protein
MFKVAPRYLSGVSVFLGDDITTRSSDGELAVFLGQATKGPRIPVQLNTVDGATAIYGTDNPLMKSVFEFYDGYMDAGKKNTVKFVTLRVGGVPASLITSYGLSLETIDAYDGIENDFFIYANNQPADTGINRAGVKIWDKNKRLVYSSFTGLDAGYFIVNSTPAGDGDELSLYGVDIDNDPLANPISMGEIVLQDVIGVGLELAAPVAGNDTVLAVVDSIASFPLKGKLKVAEVTGAITTVSFVNYSNQAANVTARTFALTEPLGTSFSTNSTATLVGSTLVAGDSQLNLTNRELYGKMRNALLDIEMYTPDYIAAGGVNYNATDTYAKQYIESTLLKANVQVGDSSIVVDAAATWPITGTVDIFDGTDHNFMTYTDLVPYGVDYRLTVAKPVINITSVAASGANANKLIGVVGTTGLLTSGYVTIGTGTYFYSSVDVTNKTILLTTALSIGDQSAPSLQKVLAPAIANITTVTAIFNKIENRELGIGYVKEVDAGDNFVYSWSDTKQPGFYLAHFGYMFANFCNNAAVGYNTPLAGMNVDISALKAANFSRGAIKAWAGTLPTYKSDVNGNITDVTASGTGLLGEATLTGSAHYNRCYLTDTTTNQYADPALGLLMTDEGFVDGIEAIDTYNKVIDLGKFLCVGAGLITFSNKGAGNAYIDSCGIYALGMLAGKPHNEGLSFSKIGTTSNATVSVVVTRALYNDLAAAKFIVITREKGLGWVINNANAVARSNSAYFLISTTRTIKYIIEGKRSILVNFIGKPVSRLLYEAARTRLAESFTTDVAQGYLASNAKWDLQIVQSANAIGKFLLTCSLNPALELTQVDIDAVIERTAI